MEKRVVIKNESGIHARPAGMLVKKSNEFKSNIEISFKERTVNVKSIMGIMSLGLSKGSEISIIANGEDEQNAVNELVNLVESGFNEL
ncbi:HPr family phosphocarrier protein [Crassaminicella profunda]|uniref:HPr family phosphocarrier protein n=1 Tax=Crassaminicella profunda TaxID=1286698 RepID=UPI001CA6A8B6|nr:HPr family phosphocarrier protein [Crassaminicella profunda]QZY55811.1 HPr family phosphocarrier protein [Crassaminicella profunda]